jgi:hypothetical protein
MDRNMSSDPKDPVVRLVEALTRRKRVPTLDYYVLAEQPDGTFEFTRDPRDAVFDAAFEAGQREADEAEQRRGSEQQKT